MNQNKEPDPGNPLTGVLPEVWNFSLVLGGPLYQLFRRAHLDDDVTSHVRRRMLVICGIVWLPLLLLCAIQGTLLGGIDIPFLHDAETHARFLIAIDPRGILVSNPAHAEAAMWTIQSFFRT